MLFSRTRQEDIARYIIKHKCTIREAGKVFGVSKSTVHLDVSKRLKHINIGLYKKVKKVLEHNFDVRHIRGGNATKLMYEQKSK